MQYKIKYQKRDISSIQFSPLHMATLTHESCKLNLTFLLIFPYYTVQTIKILNCFIRTTMVYL